MHANSCAFTSDCGGVGVSRRAAVSRQRCSAQRAPPPLFFLLAPLCYPLPWTAAQRCATIRTSPPMLVLLTAISAAAAERRLTIDVHARPWPYYTSIAQISDDIPITRYLGPRLSIEPAVPKPLVGQYAKLHHGHQPQVLPAWPVNRVEHVKLRPPVPRLYQLFDCVVHPAFNKASTRCNTLFCHSGEGLQKCLKIAATMERRGAFVAFFGQDTHLSAVKDEVLNISRAFSRSYYEARRPWRRRSPTRWPPAGSRLTRSCRSRGSRPSRRSWR